MIRLLTIALTGSALFLAISCGRSSHKTPIGHNLKLGPHTNKLRRSGKPLGDNRKCLDLGKALAAIDEGEVVNAYVSDIDLGDISEKNEFAPLANDPARARAALINVKLQLENTTGARLIKSSTLKDFLNVEAQDKCSTIAFKSGGKFTIFGSEDGILRARNAETNEYREYLFDPSGKLTLNVYTTPVTDCNGTVLKTAQKIEYTVTWGENLDFFLVENGLAELVAKYTKEPKEFTTALKKANAGNNSEDKSVRISEPVYRAVVASLSETDFTDIQCKKQ